MILLQVDEGRADELISAFAQRPFIKVVKLDRETRAALGDCPACHRKFGKETSFTVTEDIMSALLAIVTKMAIARSVVIVTNEAEAKKVSSLEQRRTITLSAESMLKLTRLKLLAEFMDGQQKTYYATQACLDFLGGSKPLSPSKITMADGRIIERSGELNLDSVKFKDMIIRDQMLKQIKHALGQIPDRVKQFVKTGQMALI